VNFDNRSDIYPACGLIQYDQLRLLDQRFRDDDLLLISAR
jgi:hypothetical protein